MRDDPAGLSHCVVTGIARHQADAIPHGAGRPAASLCRRRRLFL